MILIDQMKDLRIYKQQTFLPTITKDKKKGSAVLLMTPNFESSKKLMQNTLFINKNRYMSYYLERDIAYYIGQQVKDIDDDVIEEATYIEETKRSELPNDAFGVPSKRKFPLDTEAHVRSAIKFFNYVDPEDEAELARRIIAAMKKFNITDIKVSERNRFSKYYHPKKESTNEAAYDFNHISLETLKHVDTIIFDIGDVLVKDTGISEVEPYDYAEALLKSLKVKGYKLYYLSNWDKTNFEYNKNRGVFYFLSYFDGGLFDWETDCSKPGTNFYQELIDKYNINPSRALFFDDKVENIEGARSVGLNAQVFDTINGLENVILLYNRNDPSFNENTPADIDEYYIDEGYLFSEEDLYHNKDAFDSGEINLCFITGLSGSGKSTMASNMEKSGTEKYELDDVLANYNFSDENLKEYGDLINSFFRSNKKFRVTKEEAMNWTDKEEQDCIRSFVKYAISWAKSHKDNKYVIEGVELYWFFAPEELKDYAVCIKGTSTLLSMMRSASRDSADADNGLQRLGAFLKNMLRHDRAHAYMETERVLKKWRAYYKSLVIKEESYTEKDIRNLLTEGTNYLDLGDKIMFFGEATDRNNAQLKKILYQSRIKNRKELLVKLNEVKKAVPFIEFAYPELKRFMKRNVFVDLHYYNQIFFQNNTWVQLKGFNLYTKFMEKLINHPNLKENGYDKKTIFIPVNDWCLDKDSNFWNYRVKVTPISCIYHLMFEGRVAELKKIFGDMDVLFISNSDSYFKINFSTISDPKDLKKFSLTYRDRIRKMIYQEEFEPDELDTSAEVKDSKEVIKNKIIDKIETSKGVDLTADVAKATDELEKRKELVKKLDKAIDSKSPNRNTNIKKADNAIADNSKKEETTKQDSITKKEIQKAKENKKVDIKNSTKTTLAKQQAEEDIDNSTDDNSMDEEIKKLANAIAQAAEDNNTEDDAMDSLENNDEFKDILASMGSDDKVEISPTRAARMDKLNKDLLTKEINGKTIEEILNDTSDQEYNVSNFDIASPNEEEWKNMTFVNFDKNYSLDRDLVNIFRHFNDCSHPVVARDIKVSDISTAYDRLALYDVDYEDYRGKRFNIKLEIPIMEDNRFLLRGNSKSIQSQFFNAPVIKTEVDTCQLISNYSKVFLYRFGSMAGKSTPIVNRIVKALDKYKGTKIKFTTGYNLKVSNKYQLPMDYIDLSSVYTHIETPDMTIFFNQDEIRKKYTIEDNKGIPFAYHKKENAIIYFKTDGSDFSFDKLLFDILNRADPEFGEVFNSIKPPKSCTYARAKILKRNVPIAPIIGYYIGTTAMLDRAKISYKIVDKLTKEDKMDLYKDWIQFSDGYIVFDQSYSANLLLNGLKICSTTLYSIAGIDDKNMYIEFLRDFADNNLPDGLSNFRDLFIDPMTKETLAYYKLPTDFIDMMLYGMSLLADNKFIKHTDTTSRRLRRYQLIAVYTYKVISKAYGSYVIALKHNPNAAVFSLKRTAVIDEFLSDSITSDDSCINALRDVETTNAVTTKGPSGMNSARAYSLDKRSFDESMLNVLGMSTGFAGNVGITRQTTMQANVTPEGYVKQIDDTEAMNDANTLTATEALIPMSSTHDDPMRVAMSFVQTSKHEVRTEDSDPLLVTNGADEAMVYLSTNRFAYKAKMKGKVLEVTDKYIIIEYEDGSKDFINLQETIEHNSDGGYYVPLKLDPVKGLKVGQTINKDQVLAYDKYSFSNSLGESDNLAYNVGKIAKVAVINTDEGFEDSGIISASMARKLATRINIGYSVVVNADAKIFKIAKVGDHIEASDPLLIWEDAFDDEDVNDVLASIASDAGDFSDLGKRKLKSEVTGILRDMKIYRTVELSNLSPSIKKIVQDYEAPIKETLAIAEKYGISKSKVPAAYSLGPNGKLKKAQNAIYIEFFVEYLDTVGVGDKVVYNAANKAVEKSIFPEGLEPYTAFRPNEIIDAFVSEVSIDKRLVTSSIVSGALNKLMVELDRSVKDIMGIPYDDSTV